MTPQEEKAFFESLEAKYNWPKEPAPTSEPTILCQEDFEFVLGTLALYIPKTYERDALLKVLINSHRDLLRLFLDIKEILNNKPDKE